MAEKAAQTMSKAALKKLAMAAKVLENIYVYKNYE